MAENSGARLMPELVAPEAAERGRSPAVGAFGSPADCVLGVPPVGPVPTLLAPEAWARTIPGRAKAAATPTAINVLSFIAVFIRLNKDRLSKDQRSSGLASPRFTAINVPGNALR